MFLAQFRGPSREMTKTRDLRMSAFLFVALTFGSALVVRADFAQDWEAMRKLVPKQYLCRYTAKPLTIDGDLRDKGWRHAQWTEAFQDIEGGTKPRPRYRTRAKMLWDDNFFYIGAELEEPHVWGTLTNHDAVIFQDNDFEVFIDPDGDNHEYYEFEMNVLNTGWDLFLGKPYKDGGPALNSWEIPGLKTGVKVRGTLNQPRDRDHGWSVEIALPWKALAEYSHRASPPREGDQWRVNFSRVEWQIDVVDGPYQKRPGTKEDNWVWSPQGIVDMHRPEKWGFVQFTKKEKGRVAWVNGTEELAAREALMSIYYAQRVYQARNARWAGSLEELGWTPPERDVRYPGTRFKGLEMPRSFRIKMRKTPDGFEATVAPSDDSPNRWHVRQDSRLWKN